MRAILVAFLVVGVWFGWSDIQAWLAVRNGAARVWPVCITIGLVGLIFMANWKEKPN